MTTATIYPIQAGSGPVSTTRATAATPSAGPPQGMPASIARSQLYYWSAKWQTDEAESLTELGGGGARYFGSADDVIRWLLSEDDD